MTHQEGLPRFSRIVVTGDLFRLHFHKDGLNEGFVLHQDRNIRWLHQIVGPTIHRLTGLPVNEYAPAPTQPFWEHFFAIADHAELPAAELWRRMYQGPLSDEVTALLREPFDNSLVLGFELPPGMRQFFEQQGIAYINCFIHPVRFYDDLVLGLTTNIDAIGPMLHTYSLPEEHFHTVANLHAGRAVKATATFDVPDGSALLIGQTVGDQALMHPDRFVTLTDYQEPLRQILSLHPRVLYVPHPYARPVEGDWAMLRGLGRGIELCRQNVYRLLSMPQVTHVVTISSSVGMEAGYFGKEVTWLWRPALALFGDASQPDFGVETVSQAFITPRFWYDLLSPLTPCRPPAAMALPVLPNRLRHSLGESWALQGFEQESHAPQGSSADAEPLYAISAREFEGLQGEALIEAAYRRILGRAAEPKAMAAWRTMAQAKPTMLLHAIAGSDEARRRRVRVDDLTP